MNNKQLRLLIILLTILYSCNDYKREYYDSGNLKKEYSLKNGKLCGIKKVYFKTGKLSWLAEYENDTLNGLFKQFSEDGALVCEVSFKKGLQHGLSKFYYKNGNIKQEVNYQFGYEFGNFKYLDIEGNLELEGYRHMDTTYYFKEYDANGKLINFGRSLILKVNKDRLSVNDIYMCSISIKGPSVDSVKLSIIKTLNDVGRKVNYIYKDTVVFKNNFTYNVSLTSVGNYTTQVSSFDSGFENSTKIECVVTPR